MRKIRFRSSFKNLFFKNLWLFNLYWGVNERERFKESVLSRVRFSKRANNFKNTFCSWTVQTSYLKNFIQITGTLKYLKTFELMDWLNLFLTRNQLRVSTSFFEICVILSSCRLCRMHFFFLNFLFHFLSEGRIKSAKLQALRALAPTRLTYHWYASYASALLNTLTIINTLFAGLYPHQKAPYTLLPLTKSLT